MQSGCCPKDVYRETLALISMGFKRDDKAAGAALTVPGPAWLTSAHSSPTHKTPLCKAEPTQVDGHKDGIPSPSLWFLLPAGCHWEEGLRPGGQVPWCQGWIRLGWESSPLSEATRLLQLWPVPPESFGCLHHSTGSCGSAVLSPEERAAAHKRGIALLLNGSQGQT